MSLNPHNPSKKKYAKLNFVNAMEQVVPNIYFEEDYNLSGMELNPISRVINGQTSIVNQFDEILRVSSIPGSLYSSMDSFDGAVQFFVKQNTNYAEITPRDFDKKILNQLGTTFKNFETSADMLNYVSSTLVSSMRLNSPVSALNNYSASDTASSHEYLIGNLSWMYFLNTDGHSSDAAFDGSSILSSLVVNKLYRGQSVYMVDGIKGLAEYIFKNYDTCVARWKDRAPGIFPTEFHPGTGMYTSGTQQLDKWKTWLDIIYSPSYFDKEDTTVRTAFENFEAAGRVATGLKKDETHAGPFYRLLNAFSMMATDVYSEVDEIETFNDIGNCPDELLPRLAELIGWKLFGQEPIRWRLQLRNAVEIYKRAGTKQSIQFGIDAVLGKEVFDLSSKIHELWESYIPYLMYYAIATDSLIFSSFDTWTPQIAWKMNMDRIKMSKWTIPGGGFGHYSASSMDENIRMAVDAIMSFLTIKYPHLFSVGGKFFTEWLGVNLSGIKEVDRYDKYYLSGPPGKPPKQKFSYPRLHPEFVFHYRNREMPIPPWEEIPYYATAEITEELIVDIVDQLVCFGVRKAHAIQVGDYIRDNTLRAHDDFREGNSWLMFTSGMEVPPNWDHILQSISTTRDEYLSLWNGKSSHFKVLFDASSFFFERDTLEADSAYAMIESARMIDDFSPAHAIPDIRLRLSAVDDYSTSSTFFPVINLDKNENFLSEPDKRLGSVAYSDIWGASAAGPYTLNRAFKNREVSSVNFVSYKRGAQGGKCTSGGGIPFLRTHVDSLADPKISVSASPLVANISRNTFRRRDYKYLLPTEGLYDRRGNNMPISWDASTVEHSMPSSMGFSPLGFVPSAQRYHPITDYKNIPAVYGICEDLDSANTFSGVQTSTTYPCRGLSSLGSDEKHSQYLSRPAYYVDRGTLPSILAVMHNLLQRVQYIQAAKTYNNGDLSEDSVWKDPITSLMNSSLELSSWDPSSTSFYNNFAFGRGTHQLYKDYTSLFNRHFLRPDLWGWDGPTIFGHTFNSILTNSKFTIKGQTSVELGGDGYFASSTAAASSMNLGVSGPFANAADIRTTQRTVSLYSPTKLVVSAWAGGAEYRNRHILSGVDLIMTSGTSDKNYFSIFNIDNSFGKGSSDNYLIRNPVIQARAVDGLPRIRIAVKEFDHSLPIATVGSTQGESEFNVPVGGSQSYNTGPLSIYPIKDNFLTPEHIYNISVKCLAANDALTELGVAKLGLWVHTDYENGKFWNWMPNNAGWTQHEATDLTTDYVIRNLAHILSYEDELFFLSGCIDSFDFSRPNRTESVVRTFEEEHFQNLGIRFDTLNNICLPSGYLRDYGMLHRPDQKYIFEFFMLPDSNNYDKFMVFDKIKLQDITNRERAAIPAAGEDTAGVPFTPICNVSSVPYSKYELTEIFKFFNSISGDRYAQPWASRNSLITSSIMEVSGGSRLNYRTNPAWLANTQGAASHLLGFMEQILIREGYST